MVYQNCYISSSDTLAKISRKPLQIKALLKDSLAGISTWNVDVYLNYTTKNSVPTPHKPQSVSITKTNQLMLLDS